jgi:protein gp37
VADHSRIEWTDASWSPTLGCTRVSQGCDGCYAIRTVHRMAHNPNLKVSAAAGGLTEHRDGRLDWTGAVRSLPDRLELPLQWRKPRRIFVDSQSDLFHDQVPDEFIERVFAVMMLATQHTFQLLTKRHGRMRSLLNRSEFRKKVAWEAGKLSLVSDSSGDARRMRLRKNLDTSQVDKWPLPNVWLGVSVETQQWADIRVPALLDTPAAVRWVSCEPLLGPVSLAPEWLAPPTISCWAPGYRPDVADAAAFNAMARAAAQTFARRAGQSAPAFVDWVVVGGESGPAARPMHPSWARSLRDQCQAAGVPFFFKQHGEWAPLGPLYGDTDEVDAAHLDAVHLEVNERRQVIQLEPDGTVVNPEEYQPGAGTWLMARVGKKAAGRELDGRTWDEYPAVASASAVTDG